MLFITSRQSPQDSPHRISHTHTHTHTHTISSSTTKCPLCNQSSLRPSQIDVRVGRLFRFDRKRILQLCLCFFVISSPPSPYRVSKAITRLYLPPCLHPFSHARQTRNISAPPPPPPHLAHAGAELAPVEIAVDPALLARGARCSEHGNRSKSLARKVVGGRW